MRRSMVRWGGSFSLGAARPLLMAALVTTAASNAPAQSGEKSPPQESEEHDPEGHDPEGHELGSISSEDLSLIGLMQMDLEVSAATRMVDQPVEDAPSVVHVITRDEIERFGYRDVGEALGNTPGLFIVDDLVTDNVAVRGIYAGPGSWSRTLKFMVNGRPVQTHSTGGALVGPEFVPMISVERIEVVRGPASAVYGANAFLGVVNVITRQPPVAIGGELAPEVGVLGGRPTGAMGAAMWGETDHRRPVWVHLSASGERSDRSGLEVPDSSPSSNHRGEASDYDVARPMAFLGRAGWDGGTAGDVEIQGLYQRVDSSAEFDAVGLLRSGNRVARSNWAMRADYFKPLFEESDVGQGESLTFHTWGGVTLGRTLKDEIFVFPGRAVHRKRENRTSDFGGEFAFEGDALSVVVGVDFRSTIDAGDTLVDRTNRGGEAPRNTPAEFQFETLGAFSQVIYRPWDPLSLSSSVRLDHNDQWGDNITYRFGSVLRAARWVSLKALLGTAFVPPAPSEIGAVPLSLRGGVVGNPGLTSQKARTAELAVLLRPKRNLWLDLTGFWTRVEDRVETVPVGQLFRAENQTRSDTLGVEALGKWALGPLLVQLDASVQSTSVREPEPSYYRWDLYYGEDAVWRSHPANFPRFMSGQKVAYSRPDWNLELGLSGRYIGARKSSVDNAALAGESYLLSDYYLLDAQLRTIDFELLRGRATTVSLLVKNLLDSKYAHGGNGGVDIPGLGRGVYLRYSQSF